MVMGSVITSLLIFTSRIESHLEDLGNIDFITCHVFEISPWI